MMAKAKAVEPSNTVANGGSKVAPTRCHSTALG